MMAVAGVRLGGAQAPRWAQRSQPIVHNTREQLERFRNQLESIRDIFISCVDSNSLLIRKWTNLALCIPLPTVGTPLENAEFLQCASTGLQFLYKNILPDRYDGMLLQDPIALVRPGDYDAEGHQQELSILMKQRYIDDYLEAFRLLGLPSPVTRPDAYARAMLSWFNSILSANLVQIPSSSVESMQPLVILPCNDSRDAMVKVMGYEHCISNALIQQEHQMLDLGIVEASYALELHIAASNRIIEAETRSIEIASALAVAEVQRGMTAIRTSNQIEIDRLQHQLAELNRQIEIDRQEQKQLERKLAAQAEQTQRLQASNERLAHGQTDLQRQVKKANRPCVIL